MAAAPQKNSGARLFTAVCIVVTLAWLTNAFLRDTSSSDAAPSAGRIRVCLTRAIDSSTSIMSFLLPKLSVFQDGGSAVGDLRDPWDKDTFRASTVEQGAFLVTSEEVALSKQEPCRETEARMLLGTDGGQRAWPLSKTHFWDFDRVLGYPVRELNQPNKLNAIRGLIAIRAQPLTDVGDPLDMDDTAAQALEPDNPFNRIPGDTTAASKLTSPSSGNLNICLSNDIKDVAFSSVTLPPYLVFESYGRIMGDLRDPKPDEDYMESDRVTSYGVQTVTGVTLTRSRPCAKAQVRALLSREWPWRFPLVRESDHLHFQALKLLGAPVGGAIEAHAGQHLSDALALGIINATPVADIGNPVDLAGSPP